MTQLKELASNSWGTFVSTAKPYVTQWYNRGITLISSLDTNGKAKFAFYKNVRDSWLNKSTASHLYSQFSQIAFKDHPFKVTGAIAGVLFVTCLFWRICGKDSEITP